MPIRTAARAAAMILASILAAGGAAAQTAPPTANTSAPVLDIRPLLTLAEQDNHGAMVDQVNTLLLAGALTGGGCAGPPARSVRAPAKRAIQWNHPRERCA